MPPGTSLRKFETKKRRMPKKFKCPKSAAKWQSSPSQSESPLGPERRKMKWKQWCCMQTAQNTAASAVSTLKFNRSIITSGKCACQLELCMTGPNGQMQSAAVESPKTLFLVLLSLSLSLSLVVSPYANDYIAVSKCSFNLFPIAFDRAKAKETMAAAAAATTSVTQSWVPESSRRSSSSSHCPPNRIHYSYLQLQPDCPQSEKRSSFGQQLTF